MDELSTQLATILITNIFFTQIVGAFIPWLFSKVTLILGLAKDKKKLDKGVRQKGFFWKWVVIIFVFILGISQYERERFLNDCDSTSLYDEYSNQGLDSGLNATILTCLAFVPNNYKQ